MKGADGQFLIIGISFFVANRCFREYIYDKKKEDISKAVITAINCIRDGQDTDRKLIVSAREIFVKMGEGKFRIDCSMPFFATVCLPPLEFFIGSLDLYEHDFEEPFLDASCEYYVRKARDWLATEEVPKYLEIVENVLISEANLVNALLDVNTEPLLTMDLQHVLLAEAQEQVCFVQSLFSSLYHLLNSTPFTTSASGKQTKRFARHVTQ